MKLILQKLINEFPFSYFNTLKTNKFKKLYDFIVSETSFIDYDTPISTRCWYVLNDKHELINCNYCGKIIRKTLKPILKQTKFWCPGGCSDNDPEIRKLIGQKNKLSKTGKNAKFYSTRVPSECHIQMKKGKIKYDNKQNSKLKKLFKLHKKNFKHWILKDQMLYKYLLKKSYPLNFTKLNLETRLFWVLNKFQEIPKCKTCGRQLDFKNVKACNGWPQYCSISCQYKNQELKDATCLRNARKFFNKHFKKSSMIEPLFSIEEFAENRHDSNHLYKCRCKKCGNMFESKFDMNFFMRE